jgi:hypothetical protein
VWAPEDDRRIMGNPACACETKQVQQSGQEAVWGPHGRAQKIDSAGSFHVWRGPPPISASHVHSDILVLVIPLFYSIPLLFGGTVHTAVFTCLPTWR